MQRIVATIAISGLVVWVSVCPAQQTSSSSIPNLISYSGTLHPSSSLGASPRVVGVTFAIYRQEDGGAPLWLETQNVTTDILGNYSVLLGGTRAEGIPADLFNTQEQRWLGVQVQGETEQPRVLLVSVPYAMKAADAQTVGGLPPSAFLRATPSQSIAVEQVSSSSNPGLLSPALGGTGTAGFLPIWSNSTTLGNSVVFQSGTGAAAKLGINLATPASTLDVNGAGTIRGLLKLPAKGTATGTAGFNSQPMDLVASVFNGTTHTPVAQTFQWQAEAVNNNTANASGTFNLLYASGTATPAETGLKISNKGVFSFATGQMFPGTGTVTSIASGTGLTGGPITKTGTLSLASRACAGGNALTALPFNCSPFATLGANSFIGSQSVVGGSLSANVEVVAGSVPTGNVTSGTVEVDAAAINNGSWFPGLSFAGGGEVIASNRAGTTNQYGLDFFTNYAPRLSITNAGLVGIGTQDPQYMLEVDAPSATALTGGRFNGGSAGGSVQGGAGVVGVGGASSYVGGDGILSFAGSGSSGAPNGLAGFFSGDVDVTGFLTKGGGSFKIDHPLDPANKYLYHSFVESPDMMNIYNGNVVLDANGEAAVELPEWFGTLNRDFRYQLTCIGGFAPVYIAQKVQNNSFKIAGGQPSMEVSWQVTGIRQDAWANAHRIPVEVEKPERERGYYIHPDLYGAPEEKSVAWVRHPDLMKRMKQPPVPPHPANSQALEATK